MSPLFPTRSLVKAMVTPFQDRLGVSQERHVGEAQGRESESEQGAQIFP